MTGRLDSSDVRPEETVLAVVTTVAERGDALRIARELVDRKLVACAQITEIESVYRWNDAVQQEREFRVLLKTIEARHDDVVQVLRGLHPYELPAIHAQALGRVDPRYAAWIRDNSPGQAAT